MAKKIKSKGKSKSKSLKLKFKLKELEFEIEGDEKTVKKEFKNFRKFVVSDMLPQINKVPNNIIDKNTTFNEKAETESLKIDEVVDISSEEIMDFPIMKEIVHKEIPKSEPEWVLIYAFYASNFGETTFSKENIDNLYEESNRTAKKNTNPVSTNLKRTLKKEYIRLANNNDYMMTNSGISQAKLILEGKSTTKSVSRKIENKTDKKSKSSKKKLASSTQDFKLDRNLNLRPDGKQSLKEFLENYNIKTIPERILIIVFYLEEILHLESINNDHIFTSFDKLNIKVPKSLYKMVSNTKNQNGWIEFDTMNDIKLSIQGKNAVKHDLPKS